MNKYIAGYLESVVTLTGMKGTLDFNSIGAIILERHHVNSKTNGWISWTHVLEIHTLLYSVQLTM